ncbi:oxidoreductase, short chain dehydrogenase/reductase family [marine gamma proteobacterium HTCC2148]|jgi:3-oxoacyl-[acyl-carrier protein] reductase|nr:oxidoreductase, short chain dehydrogenase/reductase family [marine gamma proteobacterium HTCC2148]MBT3411947.1 SDR family oxidoreductase [Halieaceae bacterium]MBT5007372.1 SDR family oxidoreductase [Halieaceae bacterium]MBT6126573.1 SDR family oxidoreductase [Halieaceae bacterium]MBT7720203.1 SDR family oxidoreductase [Halieaceae bacterium]
MDLNLNGKRVILSGGSRGIGLAIAARFLEEGANVAFFARGEAGVQAALEELGSKGEFYGDSVDAADTEAVRAWVLKAAQQLGGVDIVINNTSASASIEWNDEAWRNSFNVDLMAAVTMNETALPFLEESDAAAVLQVATVTAFEHHDLSVCPSYGAIKAATVNYSAQLAQNWGDKGIRSNSVSPGPIFIEGGAWDGIKQNYFDLYERDRLAHPSERLGSAEEVANVAVFVCSGAASWINGENVVVDGGFTKRVSF